MASRFLVLFCCACGAADAADGPVRVGPEARVEHTEDGSSERIQREETGESVQGEQSPVAEALTLTGPCVVPEEREYIVEVVGREANPRDDRVNPEPQRRALRTQHLDVDGDGTPDALVPSLSPGQCTHEVDYAIYVMRGECGHHVGRVTGPVALRPGEHEKPPGRLRDLVTSRSWSEITDPTRPMGYDNVATLHTVSTPWIARNDRYVPGESAVREGVCHHCPIATCRTLIGPAPAPASCDPLPREDDICEGHGYCVISWGDPGGYSSALWCRNGRWMIENESNEP